MRTSPSLIFHLIIIAVLVVVVGRLWRSSGSQSPSLLTNQKIVVDPSKQPQAKQEADKTSKEINGSLKDVDSQMATIRLDENDNSDAISL